jgi:hypothetical protein
MTLDINDTEHNNALRRYAECHVLFIIMLNVITLKIVMLSVVAPHLDNAPALHANV